MRGKNSSSDEIAEKDILEGKSGKLRRKAPSTLAAGTQAFNRGLGKLMWTQAIMQHLLAPELLLEEFSKRVRKQGDLVLQRRDGDATLKESLSIVDAKSVFDNVTKKGAQAQDKCTALEVAIVGEPSDGLGVQIRWVGHQSIIVDALTKVGANLTALYQLLEIGEYHS